VFHKANIPADQAKLLTEQFYAHQGQLQAAMREASRETTINNRAAVRALFGNEFGRNTKLAFDHMTAALGEEKRSALTDLRLADGTMLGDHPVFVEYAAHNALQGADDEALIQATDPIAGGGSLEEQYRAALDVKFTDSKKYSTPEFQTKLVKLAAAMEKRRAKDGRAA
jgi:hypothetical protein